MENRNECINEAEVEGDLSDQSQKSFRIQSDWSDTGPNSLPVNESTENNGKFIWIPEAISFIKTLF